MMVIDKNRKFIFFCNPKTGSTSIKRMLGGDESQESHLYHITPDLAVNDNVLSDGEMCEYFKATFVRNPYDRFLSTYLHGVQSAENHKHWSLRLLYYDTFKDFVLNFTKSEFISEPHFRKQIDYTVYNKKSIEFIGRYENYLNDVDKLFQLIHRIDLASKNLPRVHASHKDKTVDEYYDNETKEIVRNHYYDDFKIFYPDLLEEK